MSNKTSKIKTLANIEACECRWPIGDPRHEDFHFCGAQQVAGRPYCELHWRMSFVPAKTRHQLAQEQAERRAMLVDKSASADKAAA